MFFATFLNSLHSSLKEQLPLSQRNVILGIQLVTKTNHELLMCVVKLMLWILNGKRHAMPFARPVIWFYQVLLLYVWMWQLHKRSSVACKQMAKMYQTFLPLLRIMVWWITFSSVWMTEQRFSTCSRNFHKSAKSKSKKESFLILKLWISWRSTILMHRSRGPKKMLWKHLCGCSQSSQQT